VVSVSPAALDFGLVKVRQSVTRTVAITNTGGGNLNVNSISPYSASAGTFFRTHNCSVLAPGGSCTATVTFTPLSTGMKSGTLNIFSNASNGSPVGVSLKGSGY
jgi:hypothetical protein